MGIRKRPGTVRESREGCLAKQSTDCDPREKDDRGKVKGVGRERAGWLETISLASSARRLWFEYIQLAARASNTGSATETLKGATRYFVRAILATVHVVVVFVPILFVGVTISLHAIWNFIDQLLVFYSRRYRIEALRINWASWAAYNLLYRSPRMCLVCFYRSASKL